MTDQEKLGLDIQHELRGYKRWRWAAAVVLAMVLTISVIVGGVLINQNAQKIRASCDGLRLLSEAPVQINSITHQASKVEVEVIATSRKNFVARDCAGKLPTPTASVVKWGRIYNIDIVRQ
jgi:hypothetical protein